MKNYVHEKQCSGPKYLDPQTDKTLGLFVMEQATQICTAHMHTRSTKLQCIWLEIYDHNTLRLHSAHVRKQIPNRANDTLERWDA